MLNLTPNPCSKVIYRTLLISKLFNFLDQPLLAQSQNPLPGLPRPSVPTPPVQPAPDFLPPPEELLKPPTGPVLPPSQLPVTGETISVQQFDISGSTVFSPKELSAATAPFTNRAISFTELLQAADAVTQLYIDKGYITSGAFIPAKQTFKADRATVRIQVIEGSLEDILVQDTGRLNPNYVRSRLALATTKPLNVNRLLESLRLLQLNPLFKTISANLQPGSQPGLSLLEVKAPLALTWTALQTWDNFQTPSVGSLRRGLTISNANLLGQGDNLGIAFYNTDGSNALAINYSLPVNPRNGTISVNYYPQWNTVIQPPFDQLVLQGKAYELSLAYRQPIVQTPTKEIALSLIASREESSNSLSGIPFPLSAGADEQGRTKMTALRFEQEYLQRSEKQVLALRSQFSWGLGSFGSTVNPVPPDGRFFSWVGQAQWVRQLAPDTLFLLRGGMQLSDRPLVPLEQLSIGGPDSVRGYRQNLILANSGAIFTAELRIPLARFNNNTSLIHLNPFFDFGSSFDKDETDVIPNTIASYGTGLQLQLGNFVSANVNYAIPLVRGQLGGNSLLQDGGFTYSLTFSKRF